MNEDLFGYAPAAEPFVDIGNQRESVAEEKARLCLELNAMCKKAPRFLSTASIQTVRGWAATHKQAMKTLANKGSSRAELRTAIESMRAWLPETQVPHDPSHHPASHVRAQRYAEHFWPALQTGRPVPHRE